MKPADVIAVKELLPTSLGSEEIREQIARDILARSVFSARMESAHYLSRVRDVCLQMLEGRMNQARAREILLSLLGQMGHSPQDEGGIQNPASRRRLELILETQTLMASSAARINAETPDTLDMFPAYELTRLEGRAAPRADWDLRWAAAGASCGFEGALQDQFIALKNSPIWAALGNGAGGYRDTLGNPFPPFAYGSGMGWLDVPRDECEALGLIAPDAPVSERSALADLSPDDAELMEAAKRVGWPGLFDDLAGGDE